MSNWILYDDFVDRVRNHHHNAFSGLVTGVSDTQHSFQIGFVDGQIVMLTYRIKKGMAALQLITQIERAKITEHPNTDFMQSGDTQLDTSMVLARLTANTLDDATATDINDVPQPATTSKSTTSRSIDSRLRKIIETAAIHHFGPIGAMVCQEHLSNSDEDVRHMMLRIAQDVGASEADTKAFFQSVSKA